MAKKNEEMCKNIVGIGASAGGLEALQKLLLALPNNTGFSFIIVQHLSPDYKSLLSEILGKYTDMPVVQVEDGMEVIPNNVYVIQPGKNLEIVNSRIVLTNQREKELNLPIDMFFKSLAEEAGSKAIAIILSGTGSDGTNGIKAIKENEGMIFVQSMESAKFDGMPKSAVRTGLVDAQLSPEEIALELIHIASTLSSNYVQYLKTDKEIDEELMKKIYFILKKISNINFTHYKQTTILRRIERRMVLTHRESLSDYVDYLYLAPDEVKTLSKEVLIGVTNFFRDPEFFQVLYDKAILEIVQRTSEEDQIRVWVAGCSTGEEAYSIAILLCEAMDKLKVKRNVKIFATDLDYESITFAGKGIYGDNIINSISPARLSRYFTRQNNTYVINRDIRKMIVFSPHNVFQDPPFGKLDLISCRNMLIYFQTVLQNDLFAIFHTSLKDNGFLFLGKSEAIGSFTEAFPVIDPAAKIFSHRSNVKISGAKTVPYLQSNFLDDDYISDSKVPSTRTDREITIDGDDGINNLLLEQFMPACLVVNNKNEIVHVFGENSNFVHLSLGKFSNILFDVITDSLKVPVSTILKDAREKNNKIQYKDICFVGEREKATINLTAMPINKAINGQTHLFAIIFSEKQARGEDSEAIPYEINKVSSQRITDLEQSLSDVQGKLNRSIAEQECVNEELQAANEELLTANEELQSSNEELQSVNEELYTVNSEYQQKLTELADLNDDIANFLSSTLIGIIFVDNKLNIRRYTDYVTKEFSVMDHDIGRSLKFISYHFPSIDISEICDNVLKTLIPEEREIATSKKRIFLMRVAPYRSTENKILGCVITLVDVTTQKQGLLKLQNTEEMLSLVRQDNANKSDYLSRISHEIRTPMASLVSLVKETKKCNNQDIVNGNLDKMTSIVEYIVSIVTDLSESSRDSKEEIKGIFEPFKLKDVINSVDSMIREKAQEKNIVFEVSMDDDFSPVYLGNNTSIKQILINLLNNSLKYTNEGGSLSLKAFEKNGSNIDGDLVFVVTDTGCGIHKEFIPELFKPFTREKTNDGTNSMGLGLCIAANLARTMNGNIEVDSEVGKGSTFTVTLHLNKPESQVVKKEEKIVSLQGRCIMIAEDSHINMTILTSMLKHYGATCIMAVDGEEAYSKYMESKEFSIDCILMDMKMPKIDGITSTMMIRSSKRKDANLPIIAVSANGYGEDIKQAKAAGISGYLFKPVDRDSLLELLNDLIK